MNALLRQLENRKTLLNRYVESKVLNDPKVFTDQRYMLLDHLNEKLSSSMEHRWNDQKNKLRTIISKLDALSPLKVLSRGYSFVESDAAGVIQSIEQLSKDDLINLRFSDGSATCLVENIKKDDLYE
jgi:exodeoxyribonuclease VII large subunit